MVNYFRRFVDLDDKGRKINLLIYPFLFTTLSYGIGFLFFGWAAGVEKSSLYQAMAAVHGWLPPLWGACALAAVLLAVALITTRRTGFGATAALFGAVVWIFACLTYAIGSFWLLIFSVGIPNLCFWIWYYLRLSYFRRFGRPTPPT